MVVSLPPFAASLDRFKEQIRSIVCCRCLLLLPRFPPLGAMLYDPVGERPFEADIVTGFFRFDPLVLQDLLALRLKLAI